ncbi:hypothetical protein ACFYPZ_13180 [Streptomyces sp. NPDC005506]|uniref:hypothetical protein n=1 Tax=Streptomyces sp. NPDC005506 TaxID=3364718 RepID=UPI003692210E
MRTPLVLMHFPKRGWPEMPATLRAPIESLLLEGQRPARPKRFGAPGADTRDPRRRAMIRLAPTATVAQHDGGLGEFQDFLRTVDPNTKAGI